MTIIELIIIIACAVLIVRGVINSRRHRRQRAAWVRQELEKAHVCN